MKNKMIRFGLLICGLIFFCNPNLNIVDILPDCIGCLLIVIALTKLGDLCADIGEAKHAFTTLFWITLSKLPAMILLMWITGKNASEETLWLVFTFCYAVAETVFAMRAFSLLFDGLTLEQGKRAASFCMSGRLSRKKRMRTVHPAVYVPNASNI